MSEAPARTSREDLGDLVERLRAAEFDVGLIEAINATQLLMALPGEAAPPDANRLCSRLRPVFCKSADQQRRFDAVFHAWWAARAGVAPVLERKPGDTVAPVNIEPPAPPPTNWKTQLIVGAIALALAVGVGYEVWQGSRKQAQTTTAPQPLSPIPSNPSPGPINPPIQPAPSPAQDEVYLPSFRRNVEVKPAWVWALGALPLLALLSLSLPVLVLSRTRLRRRSEPMFLDPAPLEREARRLVPPLTAEIGDRLARHVRSSGVEIARLARRPSLDLRRTLEATQRNRGIPTLRFSVTRVHPSYLVLIDVANESDPRGRLFYQWAERLRREGLDVELLLLRRSDNPQDPEGLRVCEVITARKGTGQWRSLRQVRDPQFGERLMVVSDGQLLADATGTWNADAAHASFHRWRDRAIFTPVEPRDWGVREDSLERSERATDPGFIVLPLEESALSAWTDLVLTGQLSTVMLTDPQRFPALLRKGSAPFLSDAAPSPEIVERLINQLRLYLGERGFYWLAAIAATPVVRWELTLLIGKEALGRLPRLGDDASLNASLARNYRRLVRLPWLQRERMPNWLRLRLLVELPRRQQEQLRELVAALLGKLSPHAVPDGIKLGFERPPGASGPQRVIPGGRDPRPSDGDPIYLGYMSGLPADQLVLRAPREWASWASQIPLRRSPGWRGVSERLQATVRANWSRWVWAGGLPHLGLNPRRAAATGLLALPLIVALVVASQFASTRGLLRLFFTEDVHELALATPGITSLAINPDGSRIATVNAGMVQVWDVRTGKPSGATVLSMLPAASDDPALYTPEEKLLLKSISDPVPLPNNLKSISRVLFTPDGQRLLTTTTDGFVQFHDASRGMAIGQPVKIEGSGDGPIAISADGKRILVSNPQGDVAVRDVSAGLPGTLLTQVRGEPIIAAFFPEAGDVVVVLTASGTARGIDFIKGLYISETLTLEGKPTLGAIVQVNDEGRAAVKESDGTVRVLDTDLKPLGDALMPAGSSVQALGFSGDSRRIVAALASGQLRVWDAVPAASAASQPTPEASGHNTIESGYTTVVRTASRLASGGDVNYWAIGALLLLIGAAAAINSARVDRLVRTTRVSA